jgi:outer membrane protein OmpA-like peptidoglycan-associated protein/subtilisin family serine protease
MRRIGVPTSRFAEFNLDPALAEAAESAPDQQVIEGIIRLEDPSQIPAEFHVVCQFTRVCTGRFLSEHTWAIRQHPNVISLKAARPLGISQTNADSTDLANSEAVLWRTGRPLPFTGRGCIVAALDFGLDFGHPNFLHPDGTTRVVSFWHQGAPYDVAHPNRYGYGRVFSPDDINAALQTSDPYETLGYHPAISDTGNGSHGTHTLDIAAGNGRAPGSRVGLAPEAALIFVHLSTPRLGIIGDLGDSVRMLEALDFVHRTAGDHPCVVNISVGREAGSHDATSPFEQAMHELLRMGHGTNRAICQSAGNYGSADLAVHGWLRDGEERDLEWIVHPSDIGPEIDAWYSGNDRFVIVLLPPDGANPVEVGLGEVGDIRHNGALIGRIYHRKNDPNNRDNHVEVFLYRGAPAGVWILRLIGDYVITGRFHAWIERAVPGAQSHFDRKITSRRYTLGTIATSPLVITVGAYDANADGQPLAPFSSCGPTRDERQDKPELLAPGVGVVAARSIPRDAARQEGLLIPRSGTSMATPHATGLVAAMFEAAGRPVSISEIRDCLRQSAEPVTDAEHPNCCAWGRLNIEEAIRRIRAQNADAILQVQAPISDPWLMQRESVASDGATADIASESGEDDKILLEEKKPYVSQNADVAPPSTTGAIMNSELGDHLLDGAERAVRSSYGKRCESEVSFLRQLLHELDTSVSLPRISPAALFRALLYDKSWMNHPRSALEIVGIPSRRPEGTFHRGDWMVRAAPGTGDVGHVSVLASDDLLTPSALAYHGIASEGAQPGQYGLVVEAGPFPHTRSRPLARRLLDRRGRVPPHTLLLRPRYTQSGAIPDFPPDEPEREGEPPAVDTEALDWEGAVFRAISGGERRINTLLKIARDAGGPNDHTVRTAVLNYLKVPFPKAAQAGGIKCEQNVRGPAPSMPDTPRNIFTGRYESKTESGLRYFWAINQAGNALIAIRTMRTYAGEESQKSHELRGDIQADGTAVLFHTRDPEKFWGYLRQEAVHSIRWHDGSYLGADGKRVFVNGDSERDEILEVSADNRPTMMESLFKSDDHYLSVLLQEREWYPLTKTCYEFLRDGAGSDLLRDLVEGYLKTPEGITQREKQAKQGATGMIVNYLQHLLWDGDESTKPEILTFHPALKAHGERARRLFPHGHHNNAVLATHVAKMWLAHGKLNYEGQKESFLDWLTWLTQHRQEKRMSRLLDVPLDPSRAAGTHRYRLKLEVITGGFFLGYAEGTLLVQKLTPPKWPGNGSLTFDVESGTLGKPKFPAKEEVFDLVVTTAQEWMPDDFEGTLLLGELTASVGIKPAKLGATAKGGYLRGKNGLWIALEDGEAFVKPGSAGGKPQFKVRAEVLVGSVRRHTSELIDLSTVFPASKKVTGNLVAATHFCFGSSLLTPAGRQFLRFVCADQLAAFDSTMTQIVIIGHTDRPDTDPNNQQLSERRAENVKRALTDILGAALKVPLDEIHPLGLGEWLARFKLHRELVRNPSDRRVDLLINGSLVAKFRDYDS